MVKNIRGFQPGIFIDTLNTLSPLDFISNEENWHPLKKDELGRNLFELMEEANNPLMDRALEYIKQLECEKEVLECRVEDLREQIKKWETKSQPIHKELKKLQQRANHPALKRK